MTKSKEKEFEESLREEIKERFWNFVMFVGFLLFLIAVGLIAIEFYQAVSFCHSQDGDYSLSFKLVLAHTCNGDEISKYNSIDGSKWDFEKNKNIPSASLD